MATAKPVLIATRILDADRTALAADNTDYTVNKSTKPNLIYVVQVDEEKGAWSATYKLQWKNTTDAGSLADLAATGEITWVATTSLVQGTAVTSKACTASGGSGSTWQNGEEVEGASTSDSINLADEYYTEIHFAINLANAIEGKTYDFGVIESGGGTLINTFASSLIITSDQPSVVLNTAEAYEFTTDVPTLEFTGTDASDADIRYQIQIDTSSNFDSGGFGGSPYLLDCYPEAHCDDFLSSYNGIQEALGQTFLGVGGKITSCKFYLKTVGSPSGNVYAKLYDHTGQYGSTGKPTGDALAASDAVNVVTIGTSVSLITFTFSGINQVQLQNGTPYCLVLSTDTVGDSSNYVYLGEDYQNSLHSGNFFYSNDSSTWTANDTYDAIFYIYQVGTPLLDKLSGTDAGFANTVTPADTDPFNSGEKCDYDVQAGEELANGTYYWRVRGMDPSPGSGSYGSFTAAKSFTVVTAGGDTGLVVQDATSASIAANVVTVQNYSLAVADATSASSTETPMLSQGSALVVADALSASSTENAVLTQAHALAVNDAVSASASDNVAPVQQYTLAAQDAVSASASDNVTLTEHRTVTVQDAVSAAVSDTPTLVEHKTLAVADATSETASENVTLTEHKTLAVNDAVSESVADNVVTVQQYTLAVNGAVSASASDNLDLTEHKTLEVADAIGASTSDNVDLEVSGGVTLTVADAISDVTADNIALLQAHTLAVNDAVSTSTVDNIDIIEHKTVVVSDATAASVSESPVLVQHYTIVVQDGTCTFRMDEPGIIQHFTLEVNDALSETSSEEPALSVNYILAMQDAVSDTLSDNIALTLTQAHILKMQDIHIGPYTMIVTDTGLAKRASKDFYVNL